MKMQATVSQMGKFLQYKLGVSNRRISQLVTKGVLIGDGRRQFDAALHVPRYLAYRVRALWDRIGLAGTFLAGAVFTAVALLTLLPLRANVATRSA